MAIGQQTGRPPWPRITAPGPSRFSSWAYSPPPPARKPVWPLQESPGCAPCVARKSRTSFGIWPQFCGGAPGPEGVPSSPSSRPEKTQIELAWAGPWVGWPLPLISPALAVLAARRAGSRWRTRSPLRFVIACFPPKMMLMVLRLYWKAVGQVRAPRPPVLIS
jgi:hypothetical protein